MIHTIFMEDIEVMVDTTTTLDEEDTLTCYKTNHLIHECPFKDQIGLKFYTKCGVGNHS